MRKAGATISIYDVPRTFEEEAQQAAIVSGMALHLAKSQHGEDRCWTGFTFADPDGDGAEAIEDADLVAHSTVVVYHTASLTAVVGDAEERNVLGVIYDKLVALGLRRVDDDES